MNIQRPILLCAILTTTFLAGCMGPPAQEGDFDGDWIEAFMDENASKDVNVLQLTLDAQAVDPPPFDGVQRVDRWIPGYEWTQDGAVLVSHQSLTDLWLVPDQGGLVFWEENLVSPGWERDRWWNQGRQPGAGASFEWLDTTWSVTLPFDNYAYLSGGPFGFNGNSNTITKGVEQTIPVRFTMQEWWSTEDGGATSVDVDYEGTLSIVYHGTVELQMDDVIRSASPDDVAQAALAQEAQLRTLEGLPPRGLLENSG